MTVGLDLESSEFKELVEAPERETEEVELMVDSLSQVSSIVVVVPILMCSLSASIAFFNLRMSPKTLIDKGSERRSSAVKERKTAPSMRC